MKNYFYVNDDKTVVVGVTDYDDVKDIATIIPNKKPFYLYTDGTTIDDILATQKPDGIGISMICFISEERQR